MKNLIGKTIQEVWVEPGERALYFKCSDGVLAVDVEGDCCSESWFSDIFNFPAMVGTVVAVEALELPDYSVTDGRCRQEVDEVYGYKVTTQNGSATIAFRNSSNGYYGGWCNDGKLWGEVLPEGCKRITDDWQAGVAA